MAKLSVSLPVPAGDGVGAWVDTSALGPQRTISVDGGAFSGLLFVESSNDAQTSAGPVDVPTFTGGATAPSDFVASLQFMRVRRTLSTGAPLGAPTVKVVAETASVAVYGAMAVPVGDGVGAPIDLSAGGDVNTFNVVGPFSGQVSIEVSADGGGTFSPAFRVGLPSVTTNGSAVGTNFIGAITHARARRAGVLPGGPAPVVSAGSSASSEGGTPPAPYDLTPASVDNTAPPGPGVSALYARGDHIHPLTLSDDDPQPIGTTASAGVAELPSRSDHVHAAESSAGAGAFDLPLSFGHGIAGLDDQLPAFSWWLSPTTNTNNAIQDQIREWITGIGLQRIHLYVRVDSAVLVGGEYQVSVTINGVVSGCFINIPIGTTTGASFTASLDIYIGSTDRVGVKASVGEAFVSGTARMEVRLVGDQAASTGPFTSAALTVRLETAAGHTIDIDGANRVTNWPNEGSAGPSHDQIPNGINNAPELQTEAGLRLLHFDGVGLQFLQNRTVPLGGEVIDPIGPSFTMQPFWAIAAVRVRAPANGLNRYVRAIDSTFQLDFPLSAPQSFSLTYQGSLANIQVSTNVDGTIANLWAVMEWGFDGAAWHYRLNGADVGTTGPGTFNGQANAVSGHFGSTFDATPLDLRAWFTYNTYPSAEDQARTRDYFLSTYPPGA